MDSKRYTNAVLIAFWLVSFIPWLLDRIGRLLTINWLYERALVEIPNVSINWAGITFFGWVLAGSILIAANLETTKMAAHRIRRLWHREANLAVSAAIEHMITVANIAPALPQIPPLRVAEASNLLFNAILRGRIYVAGRHKNEPQIKKIAADDMKNTTAHPVYINDSYGRIISANLVLLDGQKNPLYAGLMVDSEDFYREFPPSP